MGKNKCPPHLREVSDRVVNNPFSIVAWLRRLNKKEKKEKQEKNKRGK